MTPASSSTPGSSNKGRVGIAGVSTALATLKDVAGITGSFVFTSSGHLVAREIHAMFDDAALAEAAQRLTRLTDTFAAVGDELDLAVIRFQDHKLYLKVISGGMLCILADGVVNMAALRMAANLVGRRIAPDLEQADAESDSDGAGALAGTGAGDTSMATQSKLAAPSSAKVSTRPPVIAPGTRRFRGRSLE